MTAPFSGESPFRRSRRVVKGVTPAAGADWSVIVPGGRAWRVVSIAASLVTSAAAANRAPGLVVSDGSTQFVNAGPSGVQAASLTYAYGWYHSAAGIGFSTWRTQPIPELFLPAGFVIASSTALMDAGDQWSAPVLWVVETTVREGPTDLAEAPDMVVELFTGPAPS